MFDKKIYMQKKFFRLRHIKTFFLKYFFREFNMIESMDESQLVWKCKDRQKKTHTHI